MKAKSTEGGWREAGQEHHAAQSIADRDTCCSKEPVWTLPNQVRRVPFDGNKCGLLPFEKTNSAQFQLKLTTGAELGNNGLG